MPFIIMGIAGVLTVGMIGGCNMILNKKDNNKKKDDKND